MKSKTITSLSTITLKLTSILDIKYIYKSRIQTDKTPTSLLIIILKGTCCSLTLELSSMVAKIFEHETDYLYRIFSFEYAQEQLNLGNLFFVHGCSWENVIFQNSDSGLDIFQEYYANKKTLNTIKATFQKERNKMAAFMDGATFFIEKENYSQAAFMLHQYIELWFRYAALFIMGKERKSHSIKEQQTYIKSFAPQLGSLFNIKIEEEQFLLKLLDNAYICTRYENNYHITMEQINSISDKAACIEPIVTSLFKSKLRSCTKQPTHQKSKGISHEDPVIKNESDLSKFIKSLSEKDFTTLKPYPFKKNIYTVGIVSEGYQDLSFMISNLLKVCILALEVERFPTRSIPQPEHNIKEVLGYILDLIPHEEMELLDAVRDLALTPETNS